MLHSILAFEGRIEATLTRGGDEQHFLYTSTTNYLRIERLDTNWPHAQNIVNLQSGQLTLVFPHNRSFVRLENTGTVRTSSPGPLPGTGPPGGLVTPVFPHPVIQMPPGVGPQPGASGAPALPGPGMPQIPPAGPQPGAFGAAPSGAVGTSAVPSPIVPMPMMPPIPGLSQDHLELVETNGARNILGFECTRYELKQRGQVMEIWATGELFPFRPYQPNQLHRNRPPVAEEQWGELLRAKNLFPLLAILRFENGPERMRFEVKSVTSDKLKQPDVLFQPPPDYREMRPLPF